MQPAADESYRFARWELNVRLRRLTSPRGEIIPLTNTEFNLLLAFLAAPRRVLSRERLLDLSRLHNASWSGDCAAPYSARAACTSVRFVSASRRSSPPASSAGLAGGWSKASKERFVFSSRQS